MSILKTINLSKIYGDKAAVDNISLTVEKGDIYGLIGKNGAGKTTFMRLITALTQPSGGEIELFGQTTPKGLSEARSRLGCIIEGPALHPNLTAMQNLEYYRIQWGVTDKEACSRALDLTKLEDTGKKKIKDFSLGMKQRLGMAIALLSSPDFLIMDEPTNGMDPMGIVMIRDFIKKLSADGITFLVSSHILTELSQTATKYAFINNGRLVADINQQELQEACKQALSITVEDAPSAIEILKTKLNISEYEQKSSNEIWIYERIEDSSELNFQLGQEGIRVSSFKEVGNSLEDYFAELIGEKGGSK